MDLYLLLQTSFGLIALIVAMYFSLVSKRFKKKSSVPLAPEPAGRWPIIGHLPLLGGKQPIVRILGALADKYGPAFTIWMGPHRTFVVNSAEIARECFTTNDKALANRPKSTAGKHLGSDYAMLAFSSYGPYFREVRKVMVSNILSAHQLEQIKHVRSTEVDFCIKTLHKLWLENGKAPLEVEMGKYLEDLAFNNVARAISGKRYFGKDIVEDIKDVEKLHKTMSHIFYLAGIFILSDAVPCLKWLDIGGHAADMKRSIKELDSIVGGWIEEHRNRRVAGEKEAAPDYTDMMLSALETQLLDQDPDIVMKTTFFAFMLAGSDTIFVTLKWVLSLLMNHRDKLNKAQEELDSIVGKDRNVEGRDIMKLPYLQAIVKETMRLYPASPLSLPHEAAEDCYIGGYFVPAGTRVLTNIWKIQRDPRYWQEPEEFRPERFLTAQAHVEMKGRNFELMPFGSGRRICPGMLFAVEVMHLTLARILHGFDIETSSGQPVDMTEGLGISFPKATPLDVVVTPRLPSDLYI
ncbi:xanthotoxin 5-hydroxylase CYP82C4-like [Aristolochia californica]|uniref:xanthotoxin 5-hydroxylase CYP82C4-like n=1 Tax=Aristolochia californica TaxID=171875 RepID=UPI0035DC4255